MSSDEGRVPEDLARTILDVMWDGLDSASAQWIYGDLSTGSRIVAIASSRSRRRAVRAGSVIATMSLGGIAIC